LCEGKPASRIAERGKKTQKSAGKAIVKNKDRPNDNKKGESGKPDLGRSTKKTESETVAASAEEVG